MEQPGAEKVRKVEDGRLEARIAMLEGQVAALNLKLSECMEALLKDRAWGEDFMRLSADKHRETEVLLREQIDKIVELLAALPAQSIPPSDSQQEGPQPNTPPATATLIAPRNMGQRPDADATQSPT